MPSHFAVVALIVAGTSASAFAQLSITAKAQFYGPGNPVGLVAFDVDGDGRIDPVIATSNTVSTYFNDLGLIFASSDQYQLPFSSSVASIAAGPLDSGPGGAGGRPDLLMGLRTGTAIVLLNQNGSRASARWLQNNATSDSTNPFATNVSIQYFDDPPSPVPASAAATQTKPTLLATSASTVKATSRTGDGSGGFPGTDTEKVLPSAPGQMAFADMTGDGKLDMAVLLPATGTIQLNRFVRTLCCPNPNGNPNPEGVEWLPLPTIQLGVPARCIAAADVNGDGKSDLLVGLDRLGFLHSRVRILLGNGNGTFFVQGPDVEVTDAQGDLTTLLPVTWTVGSGAARPDAIMTVTSNAHLESITSMGSLAAASERVEGQMVDMSDDGNTLVGNASTNIAWVWKAPASYIPIAVPAGYASAVVKRVSGDGSTAVGELLASDGTRRAFRWTSASGTAVLPEVQGFPSSSVSATAVSFDGTRVFGSVNSFNEAAPAFLWTSAAGSRLISDILSAAGVSFFSAYSPQDASDDGFVVLCRGANPYDDSVVVTLPGPGRTPGVQLTSRGFSTFSGYATRITRDGSAILGQAIEQSFSNGRYWPVIWYAAPGGEKQLLDRGSYNSDGFNGFYYGGATLSDVGTTTATWCGFRDYYAFPLNYVTPGGVAVGNWQSTTPSGSILAGSGYGTVGGVTGSWSARLVNGQGVGLFKSLTSSRGRSVSPDGEVVLGSSIPASGGGTVATRWTRTGGLQSLGDLPGGPVNAEAAWSSADGSIIVGESDSASGREAFRWTSSTGMVGLGDLPGGAFNSVARGCSGDGNVIVGQSSSAQGLQAFSWTPSGGMIGLGFLNSTYRESNAGGVSRNGNVIVGASRFGSDPNQSHAFRKVGNGPLESLGTLDPVANFSAANAANVDGSVIVGQSKVGTNLFAFRWTKAGMKSIGGLYNGGGPIETYARAVSDDGSVIVGAGRQGSAFVAWVWTLGNSNPQNLQSVFYNSGWTFAWADGVSADGTVITGRGINPAGLEDGFVIRWRPSGQRSYVEPLLPTGNTLSLAVDEPILIPGGANGIVAADFDNDSRRDLATISNAGDVVIYGTSMSTPCRADYNGDAFLTFEDFDDFVNDFTAGLPAAEFNGDGFLTFEDFDDFVGAFENGC